MHTSSPIGICDYLPSGGCGTGPARLTHPGAFIKRTRSFPMASQPIPALETLEQQFVVLVSERLLEVQPGFGADSNLYDNGLDSMAIMQLLLLVEEEYGVAIPESELTHRNFKTVRQIAQLIHERAA